MGSSRHAITSIVRHELEIRNVVPRSSRIPLRSIQATRWGGRAEVRCALYMPTVTAIRCNPVIHAFAERLKAAGKPAKVVIVACMRKLLSIMNAMLKSNVPWNPNIA